MDSASIVWFKMSASDLSRHLLRKNTATYMDARGFFVSLSNLTVFNDSQISKEMKKVVWNETENSDNVPVPKPRPAVIVVLNTVANSVKHNINTPQ